MGLFEWIGEVFDPQPTGEFECGQSYREYRSKASVLVCGLISVALLGGWGWVIHSVFHVQSWTGVLNGLALTAIYMAAGYFIHPWPETGNLGWFGGMVDDPFHWSDDYNRWLMLLRIVLWPGRFLAESIVDTCQLVIGCSASEKQATRKRSRKYEIATPRDLKGEY